MLLQLQALELTSWCVKCFNKTYQRELQNPELILFNENSKSTFKQAR